ncbi:hypothetical protein AMJ51_02265 [Microgenomates bacterium DG_75]|nr:MAG: hypothetical protein AMJ51_02265 [Microgenomates bacterium DG_75]
MDISTPERYRRYRRYFTDVGTLYKRKKARVYTGIVLSILTVAFFSFFAIRPTLVTISGLYKEIKDKRTLVAEMDQKIENLTRAQVNYNQIKDELYLIEESLPQNPELPTLIKQLEALTRLNSVNFESIRFEKTNLQGEEEKKETQDVGFNLTVSGDYSNLKQFLNSLDTLRRIILVENFAFQSETEEEIQILTLTVSAHANYLIGNQ